MTLHPMTEAASLQALVDSDLFAPWVRELGLKVDAAECDAVHLQLPIAPRHVHGGGVLCGQTMMAAADTAMVVAISAAIGGFKPIRPRCSCRPASCARSPATRARRA